DRARTRLGRPNRMSPLWHLWELLSDRIGFSHGRAAQVDLLEDAQMLAGRETPMTEFDPTEHQRLRDAFSSEGIVGPSLLPIHLREEEYELVLCNSFRGYRLLHQCFLAFLNDTLHIANRRAPAPQPPWDWYRPLLLFLGTSFSRARAAEILYLHGYALDGFAL